ncbi:MAG: 4-(cytidine 5'-diphospho)-2-C-methyl-D-erythritol kinase [Cyanobacteriota bacterium]|jgi:4-diphosphocytidyl-2-C-methyl-D-erythritol kinase|nr:4-(cytidine 5'-diphospho)-2-C-methyl-D-erythritol kinase [Cyanobacteriota bacterium]
MAPCTVTAPAKINLHLEVLGLRPDGFHELAMVMQSIDLADTLRFSSTADGCISLSCDRSDLPTDGSNLIVKAAELLKARSGFSELGAVIQLEKCIPIGAGLAGGSSDGAAALVGLNTLWGLGFSSTELHGMAAELGSDMPFCLNGGTQLCFGRGEWLEPHRVDPDRLPAVLLIKHPSASVSTPWAYGRCRELRGDFYLACEADFEQRRQVLRSGPLLEALGSGASSFPPIRNDLQSVVEPEVTTVREGLALLRQAPGAQAVAMSGSGPSLFALFSDSAAADSARHSLLEPLLAAGFQSWCCRCLGQGVSLV